LLATNSFHGTACWASGWGSDDAMAGGEGGEGDEGKGKDRKPHILIRFIKLE
jgi:hypothetical protein